MKSIAIVLISAGLFTACSTTTKMAGNTSKDGASSTMAKSADAVKDNARAVATVDTATSADQLNDPKSLLAKRSVYFDLDSYLVKDEFTPVVSANAKFLEKVKERKIIIQGNTDERGGSEYNLALGQKRAESVRQSLAIMGVPNTQMEAVSFGKEKPKASGSDEAAWAENRRADIVYAGFNTSK